MNNKIKIPLIYMAFGIIVIGVIALLIVGSSTSRQSKLNNGYIRVNSCILSIPATTRDQNDIENCYMRVEQDLDLTLIRRDE